MKKEDTKVLIYVISTLFIILFLVLTNQPNLSPTILINSTQLQYDEILVKTSNLQTNQDVDELLNKLNQLEIEGISIEFKDNSTGELFYRSNLPNTKFFSGFNENTLDYLIQGARENQIKVYAWIPTFTDQQLILANSSYASVKKHNGELIPSDVFVSPVMPGVREHELAIIDEITTNYDLDGIRLDYIRFHSDFADMSNYTREEYITLFGIDPYNIQPHTNDWINWVDYRADKITSFINETNNLTNSKNLELGAYLLPFSARAGGYYANTLSGNNYEHYDFFKVMPMIYWQDWSTEKNFESWVNEIIYYSSSLSKSEVVPVYSLTDNYPGWRNLTEAEVRNFFNTALTILNNNQKEHISLFYYHPITSQELNRVKKPKILSISPGQATAGTNICFVGTTISTEEVTEYSWESNINGFLSDNSTFCKVMNSLGTHKITFKSKDPLDVWSSKVTADLIINRRQGSSPILIKRETKAKEI